MSIPETWKLAQASLKFFSVRFLKIKWLPHYDEWERIALEEPRAVIEAPRGHGKSTFWSFALPLWDVIRGKADTLLVSYSEDQVRRLIRNIRTEVETNDFLAPLRPSTREIWGTDLLMWADGGQVSGLGFGTSARGKHPKRIIVDDPLKDLGGMSSEDQERAYFAVITGMAMPYTKIATVGTPIDFDDLLMKLEKNTVYHHWKKPAINKKDEILCPELFSRETLEMRRAEMGSLNFAREYLLERIDPTTQPFKRQYETLYENAPSNFARIVTFCDPAYSKSDGDYTAILTVGFTHGNHAWVLEAKRLRQDLIGSIVDELFKSISNYGSQVVGMGKRKGEAVSFAFNERRIKENRWDFKFVELPETVAKKSETRIGGLVPRWESRSIHIHRNMTDLLKEIYEYRPDDSHSHDDLIDALAHTFHPEMVSATDPRNHRPLPPSLREARVLYRVGYSPVDNSDLILGRVAA